MIKKVLLLNLLSLSLVSCQTAADPREQAPKGTQILLFSDETAIAKEAIYYEALLDLKKEFPTEISSMKIILSANSDTELKTYSIEKYPTLLVVHNNEIMVKLEGLKQKEEIMGSLTQVLSMN